MRTSSRYGWLVILLVALEVVMGVGGVLSGALLVADPDKGLGMTTEVLQGSPFADFLIPGIILFLAIGVLPLAVAVAALLCRRWSTLGHVAFGAALLGWIIIEWLMLGYLSFLQPLVVGYGIVVLGLALVNLRRQGPRPAGVR